MEQPIQPIVPEGTPLPPAPVGVPPFPITPFAVWTWSSPVIPEFYWNVYSSEQRIKQICKEIGKIESYLNYLTNKVNENIIELHKRIDQLTERVAQLEKHVEEEVARLDALIAQLRSDLEQEIADREQGDENLDRRITQEIHDRQDADEVLHGEISQEVQDRIHADDQLHEEISKRLLPTDVQAGAEIEITRPDPNSNTIVIASTVAHSISELASTVSGLQAALTSETSERRADDSKLWTAVNNRIERGKILAGSGIKVVNDPDESTVTISATGGGTGGATEITGTAPITVTDGEDGEKIVGVSEATEDEAGVISEARVKELAAGEGTAYTAGAGISISGNQISIAPSGVQTPFTDGVNKRVVANIIPSSGAQAGKVSSNIQFEPGNGIAFGHNGALEISAKNATESEAGIISEARVKELASGPSLSAETPLKLEDGELSLTKDPAGPVTSSSAGLSVREITPETESEDETGVVSKATIKSLAKYSGGVNEKYGLTNSYSGGVRVKLAPLDSSGERYPGLGFMTNGNIAFSKNGLVQDVRELINLNESSPQLSPSGKPTILQDLGSPNADVPLFWLAHAYFEVKDTSGEWEDAEPGCFELFVEESDANSHYASLFVRATSYGASYYAPNGTPSETRWGIKAVRVSYTAWPISLQAN